MDAQITETQRAVDNYDKFIREGHSSDRIAANLAESEKKLLVLTTEQDYLRSQMASRVYITPAGIKDRLTRIGDIVSMNVVRANGMFKRLFPKKLTMTPMAVGDHRFYRASGTLNWCNYSAQ